MISNFSTFQCNTYDTFKNENSINGVGGSHDNLRVKVIPNVDKIWSHDFPKILQSVLKRAGWTFILMHVVQSGLEIASIPLNEEEHAPVCCWLQLNTFRCLIRFDRVFQVGRWRVEEALM